MRLFLVAGEPSGDALGAALMRALKAEADAPPEVAGVGGPLMAREGLDTLFDPDELAVMGLVEVLPKLPRLLGRIRETAAAAVAFRPDALVTIDAPSFGLRVQRRARAAGSRAKAIHYVAPQVWAWRPGRTKRLAGLLDLVLALLPFEPAFFETHGLPCAFVGHPAAARPRAPAAEIAALRDEAGAERAPLLVALPGSRGGEVRRHLPLFGEVVARLAALKPGLRVVVPTVPGTAAAARAAAAGWAAPALVLDPAHPQAEARKRAAFAAADAALAASGTVTLELAASGTPMVVGYRANPLTAAIVRRMVSVEHACLLNLVAGGLVVPEYLQEYFISERVANDLATLMTEGPARAAQLAAFDRVLAALGRDGPAPEVLAARAVLGALGETGEE